MRQMWAGVAIAIALCIGIAVLLEVVANSSLSASRRGSRP
jgi:hypothetical protein